MVSSLNVRLKFEASLSYHEMGTHRPDFVLAEYAVAQMEMHTQEIINPKKKVKKEVILGGLNKVDEYLRRVIKECPNDRQVSENLSHSIMPRCVTVQQGLIVPARLCPPEAWKAERSKGVLEARDRRAPR